MVSRGASEPTESYEDPSETNMNPASAVRDHLLSLREREALQRVKQVKTEHARTKTFAP